MSTIGPFLALLVVVTLIPTAVLMWTYRPLSAGGIAALVLNGVLALFIGIVVPGYGNWLIPWGLLLTAAICSWRKLGRPAARMWIAAAALTIDLGFLGWWLSIYRQIDSLVQKYPIISLADRLEYERDYGGIRDFSALRRSWPYMRLSDVHIGQLPTADGIQASAVMKIETLLDNELSTRQARVRSYSLNALLDAHRDMTEQFENALGFGEARARPLMYYDWVLDIPEPKLLPLASFNLNPEEPMEKEEENFSTVGVDYQPWHAENVMNFVNTPTWGYVDFDWQAQRSNLSYVVGFQPHRFTTVPKPPATSDDVHSPWRIESLLLVSLLKHHPAAVYVSSSVPSLHFLDIVPTRPVDKFETAALDHLRMTGEDIFVTGDSSRLRMVGALRAAVQCLECHQVPRGTLLGAFTYRLSKLTPPKPVIGARN